MPAEPGQPVLGNHAADGIKDTSFGFAFYFSGGKKLGEQETFKDGLLELSPNQVWLAWDRELSLACTRGQIKI